MSFRMHTSHCGLRALHTRRPCRISRSDSAPRSSGGTMPFRSSSIFTGSVSFVSFSRRTKRVTWVSTGRPGNPNATDRTTLPVLRPTPGKESSWSMSLGTSPPNRPSTTRAMRMRLLVFDRKKPEAWMSSSTSSGLACARSAGVGYRSKSAGVILLTVSSVDCAERIVATRSWYGLSCRSAHSSFAVPGYSAARRFTTSAARCFAPRGRAIGRTYRGAGSSLDQR